MMSSVSGTLRFSAVYAGTVTISALMIISAIDCFIMNMEACFTAIPYCTYCTLEVPLCMMAMSSASRNRKRQDNNRKHSRSSNCRSFSYTHNPIPPYLIPLSNLLGAKSPYFFIISPFGKNCNQIITSFQASVMSELLQPG